MALETPSRPPPFMANAILNFHFDFLTPSLINKVKAHSIPRSVFRLAILNGRVRSVLSNECDSIILSSQAFDTFFNGNYL